MWAYVVSIIVCMEKKILNACHVPGAYEPLKAARSVQLRIIAQNDVCIYSSTQR